MVTIGYGFKQRGTIKELSFNEKWLGKYEAIMSQGNGYLGLRASTEERYGTETRNLFVAGTFNKADQQEVTELPNLPDITQIEIEIDGVRLKVADECVTDYERQLNLEDGELRRSFVWTLPSTKRVACCFERIVSKSQKHVIAQRVTLTPLDEAIQVKIKSGIDGQQTNSGAQHFYEGQKRILEQRYLQMTSQTTESQVDVVVSTVMQFPNDEILAEGMFIGRRQVAKEYEVKVSAETTFVCEKLSSVYTSRDKGQSLSIKERQEHAICELKESCLKGYDGLKEESAKQWQLDLWENQSIEIDSSIQWDQLAVNFALYHLHIMTPFHDDRLNIAAKGLSGEGYKGHTFWDTEVFLLPYFIFNYPHQAKKLLMHRYHGLAGAKLKAESNGYPGAMYPWESAWLTDGETTPRYGEADIVTGEPIEILTGLIEHHITADVALGFEKYLEATGDKTFYQTYGHEVIIQTAVYWLSRVSFNEEFTRYEILDVIGPDEYKEHVNNNAYTNYLAHWNLTRALELCQEWDATVASPIDVTLSALITQLKEVLAAFYLPQVNEEGILPQDDTYLLKKNIPLDRYKKEERVGMIFRDYNLEQINQFQVSKQADVLLLMLLQGNRFTEEQKKLNWDYYEPRTLHDSSLSLSTHSVLASQLNLPKLAYDLFQEATLIDLGTNMSSSDAGIHSAAMGGIWQAVFHGFAGITVEDNHLLVMPKLPIDWRQLKLSLMYQGQRLAVIIKHDSLAIVNVTQSRAVEVKCGNQVYQVMDRLEISY